MAATAVTASPDDRYRGYFGPSHGFRINTLPFLVVGGYPRFQYDGYWISAVDPDGRELGHDWYDTDDVYIAYVDNGYYMYNRSYPTRELRSISRFSATPGAASQGAASFPEHMTRSITCLERILMRDFDTGTTRRSPPLVA